MLVDIHNTDHIEKVGSFYTAKVDDFELHSAFQPIISLTHHRPIGYECLVRPYYNGEGTSADKLFKSLGKNAFASELDRTCRTLHLMNAGLAITPGQSIGWLFLNVDANTIMEDFYSPAEVRRALEPLGFFPSQIVLEILEKNIEDPQRLAKFVEHYKEMGFKIALDDFGAGESNFERIHTIHPSIVKLDRMMLHHLADSANGGNILKRVVALLREMGSMVLVEGIETEEQAMMVLETDADLVQGYYFCKPVLGTPPRDQGEAKRQIKKLSLLQKSAARKRVEYRDRLESQLKEIFEKAVSAGEKGDQAIAEILFQRKHMLRFYTLDHQGYQINDTVSNPNLRQVDTTYHPLQKMAGANWARRDFFFEALHNPGKTFFSSPYLSLPEETLSITLSSTYKDQKGMMRILCVDVDANALDKMTLTAVRRLYPKKS